MKDLKVLIFFVYGEPGSYFGRERSWKHALVKLQPLTRFSSQREFFSCSRKKISTARRSEKSSILASVARCDRIEPCDWIRKGSIYAAGIRARWTKKTAESSALPALPPMLSYLQTNLIKLEANRKVLLPWKLKLDAWFVALAFIFH